MNGILDTYNNQKLIHTWTYKDAQNKTLGFVARYQNEGKKKEIVPYFKHNGLTWKSGIDLNPRPLFGLEQLGKPLKPKNIFVVEGEKAAAALQSIGIPAVTSFGGSPAAKQTDWTPLSGCKTVYLLPDNDEPGEHYMQDVYGELMALEAPLMIKVSRLSNLPEKGDVVDWIQSWIDNWDGYKPIESSLHRGLMEELEKEIKNADSVPESWTLGGLGGCDSSGFVWEKPGEIETQLSPVQPLSNELIPEPFRGWLADVSYRMQTPGDFSAVTAIVIVSSLIGAGCAIRPKKKDSWAVIPNLWCACIGRPSVVLKSPSMKEPMHLLEKLQVEYGEKFEQERVGNDFDEMANKAFIDDIKSRLATTAKGKGKDGIVQPDDLGKLKADYLETMNAAIPKATRRMFKTNEYSVQKMTELQNQNPRGILVFRDELTASLARWDREENIEERTQMLEGWNGDHSHTDAKIGRGLTEAKSVCTSLAGGIQPDRLSRYLYQAGHGLNDGLMQRLQLAVWPDEPKGWELVDIEPNYAERERAFAIMRSLAAMNFEQHGAIQENEERPYFHFDSAGQEVFNAWITELQTIKLNQKEDPLLVEHLGKYKSLMPSLALIFHCMDIADGKAQGNVSERSARLAVKWCDYLESHARRVYAMADSPEHSAALRLAEKIKDKALPNPFAARDVYRKCWHGLNDKKEVDAACNILIDESWLMMQRKPKSLTGRPPAPEYFINPIFL